MLYIADAPELLTAVDNRIVTFHQLAGVNHTRGIGPMAYLQIPRIVPIGIILVLILILFELAFLLLKPVLAVISPGYSNSNLAVTTNIQPINPYPPSCGLF
jgi:hypothetical protein